MKTKEKDNCKCTKCKKTFVSFTVLTKQGSNVAYNKPWTRIRCVHCGEQTVERIQETKIEDIQLNKWAAQNKEYAKR